MEKKLTWEEILKLYDQEWVQLIDYDWPEGTPYPRDGVVCVHSRDRKEFYQIMKGLEPKPDDSAIVYVGTPRRDSNVIYMNPVKLAQCS